MSVKVQNGNGVTFLGMLTILFIGLKLTNYIAWSWWWVLCPLWGGFAFVLVIICLAALISAVLK